MEDGWRMEDGWTDKEGAILSGCGADTYLQCLVFVWLVDRDGESDSCTSSLCLCLCLFCMPPPLASIAIDQTSAIPPALSQSTFRRVDM